MIEEGVCGWVGAEVRLLRDCGYGGSLVRDCGYGGSFVERLCRSLKTDCGSFNGELILLEPWPSPYL